MDWDHSDFCENRKIPIYENIGDIQKEINN